MSKRRGEVSFGESSSINDGSSDSSYARLLEKKIEDKNKTVTIYKHGKPVLTLPASLVPDVESMKKDAVDAAKFIKTNAAGFFSFENFQTTLSSVLKDLLGIAEAGQRYVVFYVMLAVGAAAQLAGIITGFIALGTYFAMSKLYEEDIKKTGDKEVDYYVAFKERMGLLLTERRLKDLVATSFEFIVTLVSFGFISGYLDGSIRSLIQKQRFAKESGHLIEQNEYIEDQMAARMAAETFTSGLSTSKQKKRLLTKINDMENALIKTATELAVQKEKKVAQGEEYSEILRKIPKKIPENQEEQFTTGKKSVEVVTEDEKQPLTFRQKFFKEESRLKNLLVAGNNDCAVPKLTLSQKLRCKLSTDRRAKEQEFWKNSRIAERARFAKKYYELQLQALRRAEREEIKDRNYVSTLIHQNNVFVRIIDREKSISASVSDAQKSVLSILSLLRQRFALEANRVYLNYLLQYGLEKLQSTDVCNKLRDELINHFENIFYSEAGILQYLLKNLDDIDSLKDHLFIQMSTILDKQYGTVKKLGRKYQGYFHGMELEEDSDEKKRKLNIISHTLEALLAEDYYKRPEDSVKGKSSREDEDNKIEFGYIPTLIALSLTGKQNLNEARRYYTNQLLNMRKIVYKFDPNRLRTALGHVGNVSGNLSAAANAILTMFGVLLILLALSAATGITIPFGVQIAILIFVGFAGWRASHSLTRKSVMRKFKAFGEVIKEGSSDLSLEEGKRSRLALTLAVGLLALIASIGGSLFAYVATIAVFSAGGLFVLPATLVVVLGVVFCVTSFFAIASLWGGLTFNLFRKAVKSGQHEGTGPVAYFRTLTPTEKLLSLIAVGFAVILAVGTAYTGYFSVAAILPGMLGKIGLLTALGGLVPPLALLIGISYGVLMFGTVFMALQQKLVTKDQNWENYTPNQKALSYVSTATNLLGVWGTLGVLLVLPVLGISFSLPLVIAVLGAGLFLTFTSFVIQKTWLNIKSAKINYAQNADLDEVVANQYPVMQTKVDGKMAKEPFRSLFSEVYHSGEDDAVNVNYSWWQGSKQDKGNGAYSEADDDSDHLSDGDAPVIISVKG